MGPPRAERPSVAHKSGWMNYGLRYCTYNEHRWGGPILGEHGLATPNSAEFGFHRDWQNIHFPSSAPLSSWNIMKYFLGNGLPFLWLIIRKPGTFLSPQYKRVFCWPDFSGNLCHPLVMTNIAMESHHFQWENSRTFDWAMASMTTLNYQAGSIFHSPGLPAPLIFPDEKPISVRSTRPRSAGVDFLRRSVRKLCS